jgi:hypothetical protein
VIATDRSEPRRARIVKVGLSEGIMSSGRRSLSLRSTMAQPHDTTP